MILGISKRFFIISWSVIFIVILLCSSFLFADKSISTVDNKDDNRAVHKVGHKGKNPKLSITYKKPKSKADYSFEQLIRNSPEIESVAVLINKEIELVAPLSLVFGEDEGPLFDNETNNINIPYSFLAEVRTRFKDAKYQKYSGMKINEVVIDALLYTIFHELAHALIAQFDLPVLGKEEDAADGLASIFLIEYFEQGQEVVITAADLFDLENQDIEEFDNQDFWSEHSLDIQRYYSNICHVYGSAPNQYKQIQIDQLFSDKKAENCIDDYETLLNSWSALLKPYLKTETANNN